jgi:hypothetical protein
MTGRKTGEEGEKMVAIDAATADIAHKFAGNS